MNAGVHTFGKLVTYDVNSNQAKYWYSDFLDLDVCLDDTENTKKAFKYIQHIEIEATGTSNVTVSRSLKLGLPYRTAKVVAETRDGVVSTTGTLVVPVNTAQTATTGDPRGLFDLKTYASAAHVVAVLLVSPEVFEINGKEVGGLFGIPHFA